MKKILSLVMASIMLVLTATVSFAAITETITWESSSGGTVKTKWDFTTVRYAEDENGDLIVENDGYKTVSKTVSKGKFLDNYFCTTREIVSLNTNYRDSDGNYIGEKIDEDFYETFDRVGEYIALNAFNTTVKNIRRIDLYLKSRCEVDFEVFICQSQKEEPKYKMVSVYDGKTQKTDIHTVIGDRTDEHVACYYPIVLDGATELLANENAPGQIVIKVKGYDAEGNPLPDGTLLPNGNSFQIAEMRLDVKNTSVYNDIMGIGHLSQDNLTNSTYYQWTQSSNTTHKKHRSIDRVAGPHFVGYSVSGALDPDNPDVDRSGYLNSNIYIFVEGKDSDAARCALSSYYPASSWPVKDASKTTADDAVLFKVVPNASGKCYWIGDMGKMSQAINHIKLNVTSGNAKKVNVYSSDTPSTKYYDGGIGSGAFANPDHESWKLMGTAENVSGVAEVFLHDSEPARLWMVEIEEYDGDLQLDPFNLYIRSELELPEYLGAEGELEGTLAPNETLTYSIDAENLSDEAKVLFALYEDDSLKVVTPVDVEEIAEAGKIDKAVATYKIPSDAEGTLSCRAFFWNSLRELIPLRGVESLPSAQ